MKNCISVRHNQFYNFLKKEATDLDCEEKLTTSVCWPLQRDIPVE